MQKCCCTLYTLSSKLSSAGGLTRHRELFWGPFLLSMQTKVQWYEQIYFMPETYAKFSYQLTAHDLPEVVTVTSACPSRQAVNVYISTRTRSYDQVCNIMRCPLSLRRFSCISMKSPTRIFSEHCCQTPCVL